MTQQSESETPATSYGKRPFGTGRTFEDLLNEVYRHNACLTRDLERIQAYLEAVSRKRGNT